ncbi:DUF2254 domain-containing protein [Vibrio rumoiensis]|uniref:DUF2254 domain-containing protein n=1 Tax=Vibrio rumoiensis 1S-45 TaxID=1188252 RepID=A0A1E5E051_9VIBR|nr:DUF2254 domain-containing protein [Vibrio rumoiensis]OEF23668.1 hypothetical protein A1QC_11200 [Vibrio rumoiensis 1S-45]
MAVSFSRDHIRFLFNRLKDKLWVKPLWMCICSIFAVFVAKVADHIETELFILPVSLDSLVTLLEIMASSMLVIATFSVGSMVSAYASASTSATPRAFTLVVSDDVSKNALSRFIGSFIFSIVALTAVKNEFFGVSGLFVLFILTGFVFALVILTFIRWVDRLARLGRIGSTVDRVEKVAMDALIRQRNTPNLSGARCIDRGKGEPVVATSVGYIQHVDISRLHQWAEKFDANVILVTLPGDFVAPGTEIARVILNDQHKDELEFDYKGVIGAFQIGADRLFDDDPRFGLVVLSEIASKALSPAVNDPGSAIKVIGSMVRLFATWSEPVQEKDEQDSCYDRVQVPEVKIEDMFNDAFTPIARDGAACLEVVTHLQKSLVALHLLGDERMKQSAKHHAQMSLKRSQLALDLPEDVLAVRDVSLFAGTDKI